MLFNSKKRTLIMKKSMTSLKVVPFKKVAPFNIALLAISLFVGCTDSSVGANNDSHVDTSTSVTNQDASATTDKANANEIEKKIVIDDNLTVNNEALKIQTIKNIYDEAIKQSKASEDFAEIDFIADHADDGFKSAISKAMNHDGEEEVDNCTDSMYLMKFVPGNGCRVSDVETVEATIDKLGRVKVTMGIPDGAGKYNHEIFFFKMSCHENVCKISDIIDEYGDSGLQLAEEWCNS